MCPARYNTRMLRCSSFDMIGICKLKWRHYLLQQKARFTSLPQHKRNEHGSCNY